ncbi:MAG: radical SAM family heme chaperone HemW [Bacteroidales bacterium]|nr:radical SAM family heme chaperone HemW [Bacteroidales bacterium]
MSGLYVHIPFCVKKCGYCDFYSVKLGKDTHLISNFTEKIINEILLKSYLFKNQAVETVYFGGGTPSLLTVKMLEKIFDALNSNFSFADKIECTLEINPEHATDEYFSALKASGFVNRLSTGFQAMDDDGLKYLGRNHSVTDNYRYLDLCRKYGFDNFSVDYIFGYETLTEREVEKSMKFFCEEKIPHISAYSLGIEDNTPFALKLKKGLIHKPDDDFFLRQFSLIHSILEDYGYNHYEISNYSLPDKHSRHNSNYWNFVPYLGFGPSAHSYYNNSRSWNCRSLSLYFEQIDNRELFDEQEILTETDIYNEKIMLGLRTKKGLKLADFPNLMISQFKDYFIVDDGYLKLNLKGWFISDYIISELFA